MGQLIKVLSKEKPVSESLYSNSVRFETAECIHFHWRNFRILLTPKQFRTVAQTAAESVYEWKKIGEEKGDGNGIVLRDQPIPDDQLLKDTVSVELNKGCVHVHFKDMRFEFKKDEFLQFADCMNSAAEKIKEQR